MVPPYDPTVPNMLPPLPLTGDWANNYRTATEQMNCANVAASKLLELPAAIKVHGCGGRRDPARRARGNPHQGVGLAAVSRGVWPWPLCWSP